MYIVTKLPNVKFFLTLSSFIVYLIAFNQTLKLEGRIFLSNSELVTGQITVFKLPDSTLIKGTYIDSTYFTLEIPIDNNSNYFAKISVAGYVDTLVSFNYSGNSEIDLGVISPQKDLELNTIDVIYRKPIFVRNIDGIQVNVSGTTLETLGNLFDILKASPNLKIKRA